MANMTKFMVAAVAINSSEMNTFMRLTVGEQTVDANCKHYY